MSDLILCPPCFAQLHDFCVQPKEASCCCWSDDKIATMPGHSLVESFTEFINDTPKQKDGTELNDIISTGRKRAAILKPIPAGGTICEWAGLKFAGGGAKPITGCASTVVFQERGKYARHHGPDKSTLNNAKDNLHLICPTCHNRWHSLNDPLYGIRPDEGKPFLPVGVECFAHDFDTKSSIVEIMKNEIWWGTNPVNRKVYDEEQVDE